MTIMTRIGALAAVLCLTALPALSGPAADLIMAERGPWKLDPGPRWSMARQGPAAPGFQAISDGEISLRAATDASDGKPMMELVKKTPEAERAIGTFPLSVSDPVTMFFLESVARDVATLTGGSPFYIRNRLKDAVFRGPDSDVVTDGDHQLITLHPFSNDPKKARLLGFDTLTLRFVMDADPKKPIRELTAQTTGPIQTRASIDGPAAAPAPYRYTLVLE